ncbi:MAG TPA: hypothetical protein VM597_11240 [Gemmataceae bacterium]|nr:hypothetical protein [Gemmataceae bacterium]
MPVPPRPPRSRAARRFAGSVGVLFAAALVMAQPADPPKPPDRASAVKLPDGTVVFLTKSPDEANPPIDGVYLSPQEYKALVEQAEQLRKLKDAPRPQAPSECRIAGKVEPRGERTVAVLTLTYSFRTTAPKAVVSLGAQKAFPLAARLDGGKLPALAAGDDGLTALVESPGEHTLALDVEAPVGPRGGKAEVGFEVGLPRAAITTLSLAPPEKVKQVTVGVRTAADKGGEPKRATADAAALGKYPLGPAELLEVAWQPPTAAPMTPEAALTAEVDAAVRVDDARVETTATVRLRGPAREWALVLPLGADVEARRATPASPRDPATEPPLAAASPGLTRPADPTKTNWTFRPPDPGGSDWDLTVTARQPRPMPGDPKSREPFAVGPFAVPTAGRASGTVKVYAPPHLRLSFEPAADVRRQDAPPPEEDLAAVFRFTAIGPGAGPPQALLKVRAHPARTYTRVQPTYTLRRTETGWRLETEAAVTPVRTEIDQVVVEVPAGWQSLEAGPLELVEGVEEIGGGAGGRRYSVRLIAPQKTAFTLTLSASFPLADPAGAREATLPLPRFPEADEAGAKLTAGVPDTWEVKGTAIGSDGTARELKSANPAARQSAAVTAVAGQFDKGLARVQLTWQPYRPELIAELRAEVALADGQLSVSQTVRFRAADGEARPIRLRGPAGVVGLRSTRGGPAVDPVGPGEWTVRPPADGAREFTLSVTYALPAAKSAAADRVAVGLLWPVDATRVEATVRVFGGGSARRVARFDGPWRELPPEPAPDRDTLPVLTLAGTGTGTPALPLTLELSEPTDGGLPAAEVERALVQAWQADDGSVAVRARFRLWRWSPAGVDVQLPPGVSADVSVDGKRVEVAPLSTEPRVVRVPVPEPRVGRPLLLDVRHLLPANRPGVFGDVTLTPPRLPGATFRTPARWQVILPTGAVPLTFGRDLQPEVRWGVRRGMPAPVASASTEDLDQWMADGTDPDADGEPTAAGAPSGDALTAVQPVLGSVKLYRFSRVRFAAVCSLAALVLGLAVSRLRPALIGPALGVVGVAAAVLAAGWPQPAAQVAAAALPGVVGLVAVLGGLAAVRWYYRRQVTHLPGFTRAPVAPAPSTPGSSPPAGPRSSQTGSGVEALDGTTGSHPQPAPSGS